MGELADSRVGRRNYASAETNGAAKSQGAREKETVSIQFAYSRDKSCRFWSFVVFLCHSALHEHRA